MVLFSGLPLVSKRLDQLRSDRSVLLIPFLSLQLFRLVFYEYELIEIKDIVFVTD